MQSYWLDLASSPEFFEFKLWLIIDGLLNLRNTDIFILFLIVKNCQSLIRGRGVDAKTGS